VLDYSIDINYKQEQKENYKDKNMLNTLNTMRTRKQNKTWKMETIFYKLKSN